MFSRTNSVLSSSKRCLYLKCFVPYIAWSSRQSGSLSSQSFLVLQLFGPPHMCAVCVDFPNLIQYHRVGGEWCPNSLQYYIGGAGVSRDPQFVLRNKWTLNILELGCERKNYLSASFLAAAAFLAAASSAAFFASACSRGNCKSQHRCNFCWWQVCERKGELYLWKKTDQLDQGEFYLRTNRIRSKE